MSWKDRKIMVLTTFLLLSGLLLPATSMNLEHVNLEHVNLKSILKNIEVSSSSQGSLPTTTTLTTSTTTSKSNLQPEVTSGSSYPITTLDSNDNNQGSVTSTPDMDSTLSESENDQREERIVNRSGQRRNQSRRGDNNRRRVGEQTRRRVVTRRKIKIGQDENLWLGSRRRTTLRPSHVETKVEIAPWDRSDTRFEAAMHVHIEEEEEEMGWLGWILNFFF